MSDYANLHIYTRPHQPATCWTDHNGPFTIRWAPRKLVRCQSCWQRRRAENCVVQAYYDHVAVWCAPDRGCHDPAVIAARERAMFRRRSAGQRKRWAA